VSAHDDGVDFDWRKTLPHAPRDAFEHLRQHVNAGHGFETLALEAV
jgi:hypothetical protein